MENENLNDAHSMVTRSKKNNEDKKDKKEDKYNLELDEHGNIKNLIDYNCNDPLDTDMLQYELNRLRGNKVMSSLSPKFNISPKKKKINKKRKTGSLSELVISYMIMNMLSLNNNKRKKKRIHGPDILEIGKGNNEDNINIVIEENHEINNKNG